VRRYRSSRAEQAHSPVTPVCRVLGVVRSGYHAWARDGAAARARAAEELTARIVAAPARGRATDGAPRVHAALRAGGVRGARQRGARLMRAAGLAGCHRRRRARTTVVDRARLPAPNRVARAFAAPTTKRVWVGDSTDVPAPEGGRYLAVPLDAPSRRVIGWALAEHRRAARALDALAMARTARRPGAGPIHHTDRGGQYTAAAYREALAALGLTPAMRRGGDCYDTALAERCFATPKAELVDTQHWPTRAAARRAIFAWLAVWDNRQRRHAALNYSSPVAHEEQRLLLCKPAV